MTRVAVLAVLTGGLALGAGPVLGAGVAAASPAGVGAGSCPSYAYQGQSGTDPNGFQIPNETSYVAACLNANGYDVAKTEVGPAGTVTFQGPGSWAGSARQAGFGVSASPSAGRLIEVGGGSTSSVVDASGTTLRLAGPYLGVVVSVAGDRPTFRVYDTGSGTVDTYTLSAAGSGSPSYLDLTGGHRAGTASTTSSPAPTPTATASPTRSATPTPTTSSPSPTSSTPTPSQSVSGYVDPGLTASPTSGAVDAATTPTASTSDRGRDTRLTVGAVTAAVLVLCVALLGRWLVNRRRPNRWR